MTRGRFAPSPTGPLHFGTLVAAIGSYLNARTAGGEWLVRIDDIDPPREMPGAADGILRTLERLGFEWDGEVRYQSTRYGAYADAFDRLRASGHAYPCACSRREVADSGLAGVDGPAYPGTCRGGLPAGRPARAWRVRTTDTPTAIDDPVQGRIEQCLERATGDFVVKRADGLWAYQLAVAVDDADQGITEVVRGADLAASTPRQVWLMQLLDLTVPAYMHLPVVVDAHGAKLSKRSGAGALDGDAAVLVHALAFLGQAPPPGLVANGRDAIWSWALDNWYADRIPRTNALQAP